MGFVVHPLTKPVSKTINPGKKPILSAWEQLTSTPEDIGASIKKGCNIGIVCGKASGVTVIDTDRDLFLDDIFSGVTVDTLRSQRIHGRGHSYWKYTTKLKNQKKHALGIEILNDGGNAVLPPSVHLSGDVYKWVNPGTPIAEMPDRLISNLETLFKTENELKQILSKCRTCFKTILKDYPLYIPDMHGGEGREYMLAVCTDLKASGAAEEHIKLFAKFMYGKGFDLNRTLTEWQNIDKNKTWRCDTLRTKLPNYVDLKLCDDCQKKQFEIKEMPPVVEDDEPEPVEKKQASLDLSLIPVDNFIMQYLNYAVKMTDAYPEYHFGNVLNLLAVVSNRKIVVRFAHDVIYPNMWIFLLGDSTIARKTASIVVGLEKIGVPVFGFDQWLPQSTSPEALVEELSNAPRSSLVRDEAGGFLRELDKTYMSGFKDVLCSLYDNKDYHRKIRTSQRKNSQTDFNIRDPFVNVLFATTPDVFKNYTNYLDVTSGWLVRFLYINPDHDKEWKGYRKETLDDLNMRDNIRNQLEIIKIRIRDLPSVQAYELSDDAIKFFTEWQRVTETNAMLLRDKNKLRVLGRMHTYAVKVAMLILLGDNNNKTIIPKLYIEIATKLVDDYFLINSCNIMEDIARDEKHNLQDKIIGILKTYGKLSLRDLMRYAHQTKKDLFEAIEALDQNGSSEIKRISEPGQKQLFFELNGSKSKKSSFFSVTSVTSVANVAFVATVPQEEGIVATNVTEDVKTRIHARTGADVYSTRLERYPCDKRDKCDKCDSCDKSDKLKTSDCKFLDYTIDMHNEHIDNIHALSQIDTLEKMVRFGNDWQRSHCKTINSITLSEFVLSFSASFGCKPDEVEHLARLQYKILPNQPTMKEPITVNVLGEVYTAVFK